jgi:ABC-type spermidine/putrescine transport system permease subunit II
VNPTITAIATLLIGVSILTVWAVVVLTRRAGLLGQVLR